MDKWCNGIEDLVDKKGMWVHRANLSLFISSVATLLFLFVFLIMLTLSYM